MDGFPAKTSNQQRSLTKKKRLNEHEEDRNRVGSLLEVGRAELRGGADAELAPLLGLELVQVRVGRHRCGDNGRRQRSGDSGAPPRLLRRGVRRIAGLAGRAVGRRLA